MAFTLCAIVLLGLSQGLVNMQVNNHALQSVPMKNISRVTPLTNEMMQVVNSFAIAFLTAFLSGQIKKQTGLSPFTSESNCLPSYFLLTSYFCKLRFHFKSIFEKK